MESLQLARQLSLVHRSAEHACAATSHVQLIFSACDEDGYWTVIKGSLGNTPEKQVTDAAGAPRAHNEQLRSADRDRSEQIAQRFAIGNNRTSLPSGASQQSRRAVESS